MNVVLGIDPNKAPQGTLPALLQAALDGHSLVIKAFIDHKVIRSIAVLSSLLENFIWI